MIFVESRRRRVIDQLREHFGGEWAYEHGIGWTRRGDGLRVYRCAAIAERFPGDDDHFAIRYYTESGERVYGLRGEGGWTPGRCG